MVIGLIGLASACGSQEEQAPAPSAEGGEGTIGEGGGNTAGTGGAAGSDQPTAGGDGGAPAGEGGTAGVSDAGEPAGGTDAGVGGTGGSAGGAGGTGGMAEPPPPCPKPDGQICHDFFAADDAAHRLLYVSEFEPSRSWSVDVGDDGVYSPRQLELVDNAQATTGKAVLVSLSTGYAEFDATDGTELARVDSFETVSGAARLAEGNTALGMVNTIHIVDASGELVRSFGLPGAGALGMLHVTDQEEYWFCRLNYIFMADSRPGEIWRGNIPTGGRAEAVLPLGSGADGGALASTGPVATIGEYGPQSGVPPIKQLGRVGSAHQDVGLEYFMGFDLLPNGNVVVANWLGEVEEPSEMAPHLVELTSENELVWQWGDQAAARQIANVLVVR